MSTNTNKIRVLIVDDSALIRQMLTAILDSDPDIEVVATAPDPYIAREKIKSLNPDVLTLDVEMPRMDGITFLRNLMRLRPMPVLMVSSLTEQGADVTLEAMELGAIDFVTKPRIDVQHAMQAYAEEIVAKVKMAAKARPRAYSDDGSRSAVKPRLSADAVIGRSRHRPQFRTTDSLIAIGASTGGTEAIKEVLQALPADTPGVVITQHIPAAFSAPFAKRMDGISAMSVCEAEDGQQIVRGHVYIAPGDRHLLVERDGARFVCRLNEGPPVNRHRPSVDVLFRSVADQIGINAVGVLLTGMGNDGAHGMQEMKQAGAHTIAQDEASSVVWGMPGEAVKLGCVDRVLPLNRIAAAVLGAEEKRSPAVNG
ncbi:chemotaxis response regulator protein-glutamate methylesterase [Thiohalobacter sp. IOR34]|uniref:protein-glutamate methylesterase/protein-glutamine glutaminase n=1 Tax=Thiohalobacter sp. IOR34 TaxID=3057176 RepID=UPI0025B218FB|nr:chemotaxis response regulator protein-glutamate methylesterase [Thiohalobacter sp. IOR34]WJW76815.1 chemotaxis response regulator protein-glutamate methylesterase [Thiohalobacter sp. IOR34]